MILSEKHNFVFIKGMKVAGTSVEMALSTLCGPNDIITPISQADELERLRLGGRCQNYSAHREAEDDYLARLRAASAAELTKVEPTSVIYFNHMPLRAVARFYGKSLDRFRIICVERSPYAKVISWANMRLTYDGYNAGGEMRADISAVRDCVDRALASGGIADVWNIRRYRWADGRLGAKALRYERLQEEFAGFVRGLGVANVPALPHAKKGLMSDTLDPREFFRSDQIARINALFAEEFAAFGYEMIR